MIIFKIPKPITIIGELSNKCLSYSSCNFTYISNIGNKNKFLLNDDLKNFINNNKQFLLKRKSELLKLAIHDNFYTIYTALYGGLNFLNKTDTNWHNLKLENNNDFLDNTLVFHIRKKFFKYKKIKTDTTFNLDLVHKMVEDAHDCYIKSNWSYFGKLIDSYWRVKKESDINCRNEYISKLYAECRLSGAYGGKMDNNTMFLVAPKEKHENIKNVMKEHILLNNKININGIEKEEIFDGSSNCCR